MSSNWYELVCKIPGIGARTRVLLDHMADVPETRRKGPHILTGAHFTVTSDGYALVDFVTNYGGTESAAFWGDWKETVDKVASLARHALEHVPGFTDADADAMVHALAATKGDDWRSHA